MRALKLAILSFVFLFLLMTAFSLFIPSNIRISKAVNVMARDEMVFHYVADLAAWKQWHPALKELPQNEIVVLQNGDLRIKDNTIALLEKKPDEIITELKKDKGRPVVSGIKLLHHAGSDSLTLQWYMDFRLRWYPWEKFKSLLYENIYGVHMERGLSNLKALLQENHSSLN
jgi:hypothetical protein